MQGRGNVGETGVQKSKRKVAMSQLCIRLCMCKATCGGIFALKRVKGWCGLPVCAGT